MAKKSDPLSESFGTDDSDGWLGGFVADEDEFDRRSLWRLGLWGVAAVGALTLAIMSAQLPVNVQRAQLAANELAGQAKQVEAGLQENKLETRRLSAAIETLNGDRDRLFSRLSALEQNLDLVTGSIKKANETPAPWPDAATALMIDSVPFPLATPAEPPRMVTSAIAPAGPERASEPGRYESAAISALALAPAATPPRVIQAAPVPEPQAAPERAEKAADETAVAMADFGVDLGSANSISGLRALWRGLVNAHKAQLDGLRPLIAVHERHNGLGLQLRLIAGPIKDAAAAARICAALDGAKRECKTAAFDGQRLSLVAEPEEPKPLPRPRRPPPPRPPQAETPTRQPAAEQSSTVGTMLSSGP